MTIFVLDTDSLNKHKMQYDFSQFLKSGGCRFKDPTVYIYLENINVSDNQIISEDYLYRCFATKNVTNLQNRVFLEVLLFFLYLMILFNLLPYCY